jgi:glycosyltransferase involved in cell wall biosynthesis
MRIAFLAPYTTDFFYRRCGLSEPSPRGKDVWFFRHVPDRSFEVDIIGCLASLTYKKRIPLVLLQVLSFLPHRHKYDVVISSGFLNGVLFSTVRKMMRFEKPRHLIIDTRAFSALNSDISVKVARFLLSPVDGVVCLSQAEQGLWERFLGFTGRATWAPFAIDTDFSERARQVDQRGEYIFAGGSSCRDWPTLVSAARNVNAKLIVAAGRDAESGKYGLEELSVPPNVEIRLDVPREEFRHLLSNALFVVVPLRYVPFAVGTEVIGQAMACGKAVVATRIPTIMDYIRAGQTGLLVEPGDVAGLEQKLRFLLDRPDERKRIAANAKAAASTELGEAALGKRVWELLQTICAETQQPPTPHHSCGAAPWA